MIEYKNKIINLLESNIKIRLATVNSAVIPRIATVGFVNDNETVYILAEKKSEQVCDVRFNNRIAFTVEERNGDEADLPAANIEAEASLIDSPYEVIVVCAKYLRKYPSLKKFPFAPGMLIVKIEPIECVYIDIAEERNSIREINCKFNLKGLFSRGIVNELFDNK